MAPTLDFGLVSSILSYSPDTGDLHWKRSLSRSNAWNACWPGKKAGTAHRTGYLVLGINGKMFLAHRIAWMLHYGEMPIQQIDHINGDKSDNRIGNLRQATPSQNKNNSPKPANNTSGYKGVCYRKSAGKWQAQICRNGVRKFIGLFDTPEEAHKAYVELAEQAHGDFFHRSEPPK